MQTQMNCSKHGAYLSNLLSFKGKTIKKNCPLCIEEYKAKQAKIKWVELIRSLFCECDVPLRFKQKRLDSYIPPCEEATKMHDRISIYIKDFPKIHDKGVSLVFTGLSGSGKTHMGCCMIHDLILQGISAVYTSTKKFSEIRQNYQVGLGLTESATIKLYVKPEFLVIDEIGFRNSNDFIRNILFQIIDGRYEQKRPTLLISNLNIKDLTDYVGDRVMDRIFERHGSLFQFTWNSYRRTL